MNQVIVTLLFILLVSSSFAESFSADRVLRFDDSPLIGEAVFCEKDIKEIVPEDNQFQILNLALMSSEQGDRFALITIKNTSVGQRFLKREHLVAIFADCSRRHPVNIEYKFRGGEVLTREINFGISRFPIIKIINQPE